MDSKEKKQKEENHINGFDKSIFFIGLALLLALLGYLVFQIAKKGYSQAKLEISTVYQPRMENYAFKVTLENTGDKTAEMVNLKLELYRADTVAASGTVTVDYVPAKSKKTAWIVFHQKRGASDSLAVASLTYMMP